MASLAELGEITKANDDVFAEINRHLDEGDRAIRRFDAISRGSQGKAPYRPDYAAQTARAQDTMREYHRLTQPAPKQPSKWKKPPGLRTLRRAVRG